MENKNQMKVEKILRLPSWIKFPISKASEFEKMQRLIKKSNIHTICEEGRCPNTVSYTHLTLPTTPYV